MKSLREMFSDIMYPEPVKIITPFGQNTVLSGVTAEELDESIQEMIDGIRNSARIR